MALAAFLGSGREDRLNDAYQLANTIPNILYEAIIGGLLSAMFIPLLISEQKRSGKDSTEAWRIANLLLGYAGVILFVISVLGFIFSPAIVSVLTAYGHHEAAAASRQLAVYFFRFFSWQMFFYGLNAVFMAILNSHDVFGITAAAPILNNVVVIITLILFRMHAIGVAGLAIGTTGGIAAMALIQLPWLKRVRMPLRPTCNFRDPVFRSVASLGAPIALVGLANFINISVRSNLLWSIPGGFTAFNLCFQIIMMPHGIFAVALSTVLYPALTRHAAEENWRDVRGVMWSGLRWTMFIMLPIALGMSALAVPLTRVMFEREKFTYSDSIFFARFLRLYSLSIVPYSAVLFLTRVFYSTKDTRTPAWINISGVAMNIVLNLVLIRSMGLPGIGLSAVITYCFTTALSMFILLRRFGVQGAALQFGGMGKMTAAGIAMAMVVGGVLGWSNPRVVSMEKGARLSFRLPDSFVPYGYLLVRSPNTWTRLWRQFGRSTETVPPIDFAKNSVVAVFGPPGAAPSELRLENYTIEKDTTAALNIVCRRGKPSVTTSTLAADTPTSPSYLLAIVGAPVRAVDLKLSIATKSPPGLFGRLLQAPDAFRLVALSLLGAIFYFAATLALRLGESQRLQGYLERMRKK